MLTYSFADLGSDSLYGHLYRCLKNDVIQGNLRPGEHLPSKRTFAKNLGISIITVENAYAQLIAEGYIYSIPKKGFYVSDLAAEISREKTVLTPEQVQLSAGQAPLLADFTSNQTEPEIFPFSIWSRLMREQLSEKQSELMTNPPSGGVLALREAIAQHLKEFHGLQASPEQIIIGAGTEYLCGLLIQLLGFDRIYGVEEPGYNKICRIYRSHSLDCRYVPMDASGISVPALQEQNIDIVHSSPAHQYPTGLVMPVGRRYELLGWAAQSDRRYIIEDDFDSELRLKGKTIPTMQSIDVMEKVIYMNTFTKTLSSTIRISYMVLPQHLIRRFYAQLQFYACTVSNFEQYTLARLIQDGYFEKHINRMRSHYRAKRDLFLSLIAQSGLKDRVKSLEEHSGLHFLLKIDTDQSEEAILRTAAQHGIRLSALSQYYETPPETASHTFVINYSSVPKENLTEAVRLLDQILR